MADGLEFAAQAVQSGVRSFLGNRQRQIANLERQRVIQDRIAEHERKAAEKLAEQERKKRLKGAVDRVYSILSGRLAALNYKDGYLTEEKRAEAMAEAATIAGEDYSLAASLFSQIKSLGDRPKPKTAEEIAAELQANLEAHRLVYRQATGKEMSEEQVADFLNTPVPKKSDKSAIEKRREELRELGHSDEEINRQLEKEKGITSLERDADLKFREHAASPITDTEVEKFQAQLYENLYPDDDEIDPVKFDGLYDKAYARAQGSRRKALSPEERRKALPRGLSFTTEISKPVEGTVVPGFGNEPVSTGASPSKAPGAQTNPEPQSEDDVRAWIPTIGKNGYGGDRAFGQAAVHKRFLTQEAYDSLHAQVISPAYPKGK